MAPGAPLVWPGGKPGDTGVAAAHGSDVTSKDKEQSEPSNIAGQTTFKRGNIDEGLAQADVTAERHFTMAFVHHSYLETQATIAMPYLHAQIPNRQWSTYHGGNNEDSFRDMAIDANGHVYVVGSTRSTNTIITQPSSQSVIAGGSDAFVAKYDTDGNRIWSTYFGGEADDFGQSIDVDANGNIFITGLTFSANGIATAGTHQPLNRGNGDTFVAK